jgi:putative transcriptional regulator
MPTIEIKLHEMMAKRKIKTIEQLHEKTGLSRKALSKAFHNKNKRMDLVALGKLCEALDCEIGELIVIKK